MSESSDLLQLDQEDLETVIPAVGGRVQVVAGDWRGEVGELKAIDEANFCVSVALKGGEFDGRVVERVEYEEVCKLA